MEWIKVTDRIPDFNKEVLVSGEGKCDLAKLEAYRVTESSKDYEWVEKNSFDRIWFNVTHWAEIELPKND